VNDNLRDGFGQQAVHTGRTPYLPNAVGGGCPFLAGDDEGGYVHTMRAVEGPKTRERSPDDEYVQATMFWKSMSSTEQDHIVDAFTFELGKVDVPAVVDLMVERLGRIDDELVARVVVGLGLPAPDVTVENPNVEPSPTLAMITEDTYPPDGRVVHILANDGCDTAGVKALQAVLLASGITPHVVATHKGAIVGRDGDELTVDRSFHTSSSAESDGVVVADGSNLAASPVAATYVQSAFRHFKTIGAWGDGSDLLAAAGIDVDAPGLVQGTDANASFSDAVVAAIGLHRHWERADVHPTIPQTEA
jgi:catalase